MVVRIVLLILLSMGVSLAEINIPSQTLKEIADKIYRNETGGQRRNLIVWNDGENFPSLGIGHFIWYKYKEPDRFEESFPLLVEFYRAKEIPLPWILRMYRFAPWKTQATFLEAKQSEPSFKELEAFLFNTQAIQIEFIANRLQASLPKILAHTNRPQKVEKVFNALLEHSVGLYALIDYINFKGEGISASERYNGEGWGLLQVLEGMIDSTDIIDNKNIMLSFRKSAKRVLEKRVKNAPINRNEQRWLVGWFKRVDTYQ